MSPLIKLVAMVSTWLQASLAWLLGVSITEFSPRRGWPGTIVTITGHGFSASRDDNDVRVGAERAIVIDAAPNTLTVLLGEATATGLLSVTVGSKSGASAQPFQVLPQPAVDDVISVGTPRFFHGPQSGTPKTNTPNQPVLVLLAFANDQNPDDPGRPRATLRNELIGNCGEAGRWWREASFNRTSWTMTFSGWLALPHGDNFYFWRDTDIFLARRELLSRTLRPMQWQGTSIASGAILVGHPASASYAYYPGVGSGGFDVTACAFAGSMLYVGNANGSVFIHDIANLAAPAARGSVVVVAGQYISALELAGTRLYVGLRDFGFAVVDVGNPTAPSFVTQVAAGGGCYALRLSGNNLWLGRQNHLEQYSLAGGVPGFVAERVLGGWITAIDAVGSMLAVATDGDGVHLFDTGGGGALPMGGSLAFVNVRSLTLTGNLALLALYENGMAVLDVGNPAAPVVRGTLKTKKAVCRIAVQGSEAVLAVGALDLLAVSIADPDVPKAHHGEMPSTTDPDVAALRSQLSAAILGEGLVKDKGALFVQALKAYIASVGGEYQANLGQYVGIIVILKGPGLRGQSFPKETGAHFWPDDVFFSDTKGMIYLAHDAAIGRIAHEIGHWLGMDDIYEDKLDTGEIIPGTAQAFCLSGLHDQEPLFAGRELNDTMHILDAHPSNTQLRTWSPNAQLDETFTLVAHHGAENLDGSRCHVLRLVASEGLIYFVETRELAPPGVRFDQHLPVPAPGRVVVTRASTSKSFSNSLERAVMLVGVLDVGQQAVDAARNLTIQVEERLPGSPLAHRVRVRWNQPIAGDPNGTFDLAITPWSTETWESVDIAVDSPRNGLGVFDFTEPGRPDVPRLNGDHPWINHKNVIIAKVRNTGPSDVPEVYVSCYVTSPPGIGDNGNWALLETKLVTNFKGLSEQELRFDWTPKVAGHTCIKIAILPMQGEINTNNNSAQENVAVFDSAAASSHQPVVLAAEVRSPFSVLRKVDIAVRGLPQGWHAVVEHAWVWLEGKGSRALRTVIWTNRDSSAPRDTNIPVEAFPRVEGWCDFDHRYIPIGGILAPVRAVKRVAIFTTFGDRHGSYMVGGNLVPPLADVPLTIEVTHESGAVTLFHGKTDGSGSYAQSIGVYGSMKLGRYSVQVHTARGGGASEESGPMVSLDVMR